MLVRTIQPLALGSIDNGAAFAVESLEITPRKLLAAKPYLLVDRARNHPRGLPGGLDRVAKRLLLRRTVSTWRLPLRVELRPNGNKILHTEVHVCKLAEKFQKL